ncbi:hypothetical protein Bca52824_065993 [Brassica carinata]|uniref:Uncharacterized protein n=1 Tax=Brassica carinata TaxID=52824 RepID=A0A8X7QKN9_BRACI|nr:hypothetical protein Bca52824_065993 [Brassica carinata]
MSEELPKRLFKEGEDPRVTQINNNCRIDYIIRKFQAWLPKELDVVKKDRSALCRDDDVEDDRIKVLMEMIKKGHDITVNDEASVNVEAMRVMTTFRLERIKNAGSRSKRGKRGFPIVLFEHNLSGMEQRIHKQMTETFEQMRTELKQSRKEASVEVKLGEPSPTKPSTSQAPLRRSTRGDGSETTFNVNYSEADDMGRWIGTQGVEGLSRDVRCARL